MTVLHALPLTLGGSTVEACHGRWGLPPTYRLSQIIAATPGARFNLEAYRVAMGPPVSNVAAYWTSEDLSAATAWGILSARCRELGRIPADSFPDLPAGYDQKAEANRKAIAEAIIAQRGMTWAGVRQSLVAGFTYDTSVAVPVWLAD